MFESAIDLLSYGTMQKPNGKDWRSENLRSLAGVYKPKGRLREIEITANISSTLIPLQGQMSATVIMNAEWRRIYE